MSDDPADWAAEGFRKMKATRESPEEFRNLSREDWVEKGFRIGAHVEDLRCLPVRRIGKIQAYPTHYRNVQVQWLSKKGNTVSFEVVRADQVRPLGKPHRTPTPEPPIEEVQDSSP